MAKATQQSTRIGGSIAYYGLQDWWNQAFTADEQQLVQTTFQPLGGSTNSLTTGNITPSTCSAVGLLSSLAGWFNSPDTRTIAHRILKKAVELSGSATVLDVHFLHQAKIEIYYKDRSDPQFLQAAADACVSQIGIAQDAAGQFISQYPGSPLPSHKGFQQLCIILEKQHAYQDVIDLARQAKSAGWRGDWDRRVDRCLKRLNNKKA